MNEVPFHVYAMKEPDYVMSLMSMYGTNLQTGTETSHEWVDRSVTKQQKTIHCPEVMGNHFCTGILLTITTKNDNHLLVWRLFGPQNTGQIMSLYSC